MRRVTALLAGQPFTGTILLTHLHWDHVQGLPFFSAGDRDDARVTLLLPDQQDGIGAEEVLARGMSPPHFPIRPSELRGTWELPYGLARPVRDRRVYRAGVRDPAQGRQDTRVPGR